MSLSDALRLALPQGTRVIVGHEHLQRRISWARAFITRPWAIGPLEQGALVILSVRGLSSASEIQAAPRLIDALVAAKVAAIVLSDELPEIVSAVAQGDAMPVLVLPTDASLPDVERAVIGLIVDRDGQVQRRAVEVYHLLIQQAIEDAPTETMAGSLAEAAGRVVYLEDEYGVLQAVATPAEYQPLGLPSADEATTLYSAREILGISGAAPVAASTPACIRRVLGDHRYEVCSAPISLGSTIGGFLTLLGSSAEIQDLDEEIVTRAASAFAFPIAKHRAVMETQTRLQGSFVESLLAGTMADEEEIASRAKYLGHDLAEPYDTACLTLDEPRKSGDGRAARADSDHGGRWTSFVDLARRELIERWPRALLRERGDLLAVLLPSQGGPPADKVRASLEETRIRLGRMVEGAATVGLGRRASGPRDIVHSYSEAEQAARIGRQFLGGNRTIAFEELGVYRLIARVDDPDALDGFRREYLGPLEEYDARHAAELIETLEGFFACNGNHAKAAESLHLHRNSLLYRLERIEALTGRDLTDSETRLSLQLALKIRRVSATIRASQPRGHRGV